MRGLCLVLLSGGLLLHAQDTATGERFLLGLAAVNSVEHPFIEASAQALGALAPAEKISALCAQHRAHASVTVRLVALEALARGPGGLRAYAAALTEGDQPRATWALRQLGAADLAGALTLFDAWCDPQCLWRAPITDALQSLRGEALRRLIAAVLARTLTAGQFPLLAAMSGLPPASRTEDVLHCLYADARLMALLPEAARRTPEGAALPRDGLRLDAQSLSAVLAHPVPAHVPFLLESEPHLDADQRVAVGRTLALLSHPSGNARLTELLMLGTAAQRCAVLDAARQMRAPLPVRAVLSALLDQEEAVRGAALELADDQHLRVSPDESRQLLAAVPEDVAEGFLRLLTRGDDQPRIIEVLCAATDPHEGFSAPDLAAEALLLRPISVQQLLSLLAHPTDTVRTLALAHCTRSAWDERLSTAIEAAAADTAALVRATAALAFGQRACDAHRALLLSLARDPSALVRECAALSLARQDNWHLVPALRTLLADENVSVRNAAACALWRHGLKDVEDQLRKDCAVIWLAARSRAALNGARRAPDARQD